MKVVLVNSFLWVREEADNRNLLFSGWLDQYYSQNWESRVLGGDWSGAGTSDFVTWRMVEGTGEIEPGEGKGRGGNIVYILKDFPEVS